MAVVIIIYVTLLWRLDDVDSMEGDTYVLNQG